MKTWGWHVWACRSIAGVAQLLVLLAVALAIVWPAPVDREKLPGVYAASDLPLSHWSSALAIKQAVEERGEIPLWNPHYAGGRPLAGDPLSALWYPPTHLVHLLSVRDYFLVSMIGHLVLAGLGMLLLGRVAFGLPRIPALVAAVAYMATPRLVAHLGAGHVTMAQAAAWLPWVALATWLTVRRPGRWTPMLALTLAALLLAGHPQIAYYGGLMVAVVSIWLIVRRWLEAGRSAASRSLAGLIAGGVLAVLLASAHLLPMLELTRNSTRQSAVGTTDATTPWPALKAIAGVWMPSGVPHEAMFDPGRAILVLALIGLFSVHRLGVPLLLGITIVFGLAIGVDSPVFQAASLILPEYDRFRGVGRIWFVALLGIAVLAGLGTRSMLRWAERGHRHFATGLGIVCLVAISANLVWMTSRLTNVASITPHVTPQELELAIAEAADGGRVYAIQRNVRQPVAVALGIETLDGQDPLLLASHAELMRRAGGYIWEGYQLSIPPFEVYDPDYATYQYPNPDPVLLSLLGVTVVASWFPIDDPYLQRVAYIDNTHVYRVQRKTVPARLYRPLTDSQELRRSGMRRQETSVTEVSREAERAEYAFTAPRDAWLVLGWPRFPGWTAYLDGERVEVRTVDGVLPAVWAERGTHRLEWVYEPRSVRTGVWLSLVGAGVLAAWPVARRLSSVAHSRWRPTRWRSRPWRWLRREPAAG